MVKPKKLGELSAMKSSTQNKDFFSTKYSLKTKVGGKFTLGQEIYCIPLTSRGIYELPCHYVQTKAEEVGFKSKFNTYILCHGFDESTGEINEGATCCQLAAEEWARVKSDEKKGIESIPLIKSRGSRVFLPVLLLGNDAGTKNVGPVPLTKINMSGRDFCYIEFSSRGFSDVMTTFENDLVNNGRIAYELEGEAKYNEILAQFQKHIMKISIKDSAFGSHAKIFSFISFANRNIGAETGAYEQITEGLERSKKLKAEVEEFLTLFETELETVMVPWTDVELINYVKGANTIMTAKQLEATGTPAAQHQAPIPKAEQQIALEDDGETLFGSTTAVADEDEADDDLFDTGENGGEISLDDTPSLISSSAVDIPEDDSSFSLDDDEDFFGE